jgi:hypothetical protein
MPLAATAWALAALLVLSSPAPSGAQPAAGPTAGLSPELRAAFIAEMQHLDAGLQRAVSAIARADWAAAEQTAREISGSFILEQRLSAAQREELHRVLPEAFLALDRGFHAHAQRLAAAAKAHDGELAAFYTYQLTDACVSCHSRYAQHRFPALAPAPEAHHH